MATATLTLTDEKFNEIYTVEKFRNQVATAHKCYTAFPNSEFKHYKTCSYPTEYIVTEEQIEIAQKLKQEAKQEAIKNIKDKLVFVAMGSDYEARYDDDICNYRVRTHFINKAGYKCFIEVGTARNPEEMRIDHAIINYESENEKNNYNGLERRDSNPKYTLQNLLRLVNTEFNCNFSEIEVDKYNLSPSDFVCKSPK